MLLIHNSIAETDLSKKLMTTVSVLFGGHRGNTISY